jgi:hypothetical protein
MGELGASASALRPQLRILPLPPARGETPLHSREELLRFVDLQDPELAGWAVKTLLRLDAGAGPELLERCASHAAAQTVETILLTLLGERTPLPERSIEILLDRSEPGIRDLVLLSSLLSGPPLELEAFEESAAGRAALWISDMALGGAPRFEPFPEERIPETIEVVLLDAAQEWLQGLPVDRVLQLFLQSAKLSTPTTGSLILCHLCSRLGFPEAAGFLSGAMDLSIPSSLAQDLFAPIRRTAPWTFQEPDIVELARRLACASPHGLSTLAAQALPLARALRPNLPPEAPAWHQALAELAAATHRTVELVLVDMASPGRLGPYANVAGPLMATALLAAARDAAWVEGFAGRPDDDDRAFARALARARVPAAAPEEAVERAVRIEASRMVDLVAEETRRADPASLSMPLAVIETWGDEAWVDATLKLLLLNGDSFELSQRLFDSLRPLGWSALPQVSRALRLLPASARTAALEYLAEFPCRRTLEALVNAFPHYARSEWPGDYWAALAETGAPEGAEKLAREWRHGEVTIARALAFLAKIHPDLAMRRRGILEDLRSNEAALEGDRPPLLLPLHCSACGRTSEHRIDQMILAGESPHEASPTRILICKYCGAPEAWRHTRESLQRFDDALARELDEIARRGTIPPGEARFLDIRRLSGAVGEAVRTPRAEWRAAQDALALRPDDPDALLAVGRLLRRSGWARQAAAPLAKLVKGHPGHVEGRLEYAWIRFERGQLDQAAAEHDRAAAMFCCTSMTESERERLAAEFESLALALDKAGRKVRQLKLEPRTQAPDLGATASFGGFEPSNGESFAETALRLERELARERPCPCASGKPYRDCCGTVVWQPFVK